ncbi:MAG: hypothetical protein JW795_11205 [Chitinivibrionales bacterium]|nr:hypothetical protein [Chitinivibrionales bacterium]
MKKGITLIAILALFSLTPGQDHRDAAHIRISIAAIKRVEALLSFGPLECKEVIAERDAYYEKEIKGAELTFVMDSCFILLNSGECDVQRLYIELAGKWYNLEWILKGTGKLPKILNPVFYAEADKPATKKGKLTIESRTIIR